MTRSGIRLRSTGQPVTTWPKRVGDRSPSGRMTIAKLEQWPPMRKVAHVTARIKGPHRQVDRLLTDLASWAHGQEDIAAIALVGSYTRNQARMSSDVDVVLLTPRVEKYTANCDWFTRLRPGSRLVRCEAWGPLLERRYRLRSGLLVELGLVAPSWAEVPLDPGTRRVLSPDPPVSVG